MVPGRVQTLRIAGRPARASTPASAPSSAGSRTPTCAWRSSPSTAADFETWKANQLADVQAAPADGHARRRRASRRSSRSARAATRSTASSNSDGDPVIAQPENYVYSGGGAEPDPPDDAATRSPAPRSTCSTEACRDRVWNAPPDGVRRRSTCRASRRTASTRSTCASGSATPRRRSRCTPTRPSSAPTDGKTRGMPYLGLSEDQIDQVVAYLLDAALRGGTATMAIIERPIPATTAPGCPGRRHAVDVARRVPPAGRRPPAGGRGCSRSTTRSSASCTASRRWCSSSSAASRRC